MNLGTIREAKKLAQEFITSASKSEDRQKRDVQHTLHEHAVDIGYTKESAALRRASMDLTRKLADAVAELQRMEDNKKAIMSQLKSEMDAKQSAINLAAERHRSGFEMRDIECEVVYAYIDDVVRWIRTDNGEVAHERKMRPDERQMKLIEDEPEATMYVK